MRWLPAAAFLLSSASSAFASAGGGDAADPADSILAPKNRLRPEPKNLATINDRFEHVAVATHAAVSKLAREAPSNDDPEVMEQLVFQVSVTINGTRLTQSPTGAPATDAVESEPSSPSAAAATAADGETTPTDELSPALVPAPSSSPGPSILGELAANELEQEVSSTTYSPSPSSGGDAGRPKDVEENNLVEVADETQSSTTLGPTSSPSSSESTEALTATSSNSTSIAPTPRPTASTAEDAENVAVQMHAPTQRPSVSNAADGAIDRADEPVPTERPVVPNAEDTAGEVEETQSPTQRPPTGNAADEASFADKTVQPTLSTPSPLPTRVPVTTTSNSTLHPSNYKLPDEPNEVDSDACPKEFDASLKYGEGDVVSIRCRSDGCRIIYQCKPLPAASFCNLVAPGKRNAQKGWAKLGRCFDASDGYEPAGSVLPSTHPSSNALTNTPSDQVHEEGALTSVPVEDDTETMRPTSLPSVVTAVQPTGVPTMILTAPSSSFPPSSPQDYISIDKRSISPTLLVSSTNLDAPSPRPTSKRQSSPAWTKPFNPDEENDSGSALNATRVALPMIICDITLSSNLSERLERKHVLLAVMRGMLFDLLHAHLPKERYDLLGISLSVEVERNENGDEPTLRIHAFFRGDASFSLRGAPSRNDIILLLVRQFDVDEFNQRLRDPFRARSASQAGGTLNVNTVFITAEDGSLILAGSNSYEDNKLPTSMKTIVQDGNQRMQVALTLSALFAMACVVALLVFLVYSKRMNDEDEDEDVIENIALEPPHAEDDMEEGRLRTARLRAESSETVASKAEVEIEVPSTPLYTISDVSDNSVMSTLESPFAEARKACHFASPEAGLGIAKSNQYQVASDSALGFMADWQLENWGVCDDSNIASL